MRRGSGSVGRASPRVESAPHRGRTHRNGDGIGQGEEDANDAAKLRPKRAADHKVGAAALDLAVGANGRERQGRGAGDDHGDEDDERAVANAGNAKDEAKTEKHDDWGPGEGGG